MSGVRIFQPFARVWTSRIPDSDYSSLGSVTPPVPIVIIPLLSETMNHSVFLQAATYYAGMVPTSSIEPAGHGVFLESGIYTT